MTLTYRHVMPAMPVLILLFHIKGYGLRHKLFVISKTDFFRPDRLYRQSVRKVERADFPSSSPFRESAVMFAF